MAGYTAEQLGIKAPVGGFTDNGWFEGRNYDAATRTFGEKGQNWSASNPDKNKGMVSAEVNAQSAAQQGVSVQQFNSYLNSSNPSAPNGGMNNQGVDPYGGVSGVGKQAPIDLNALYSSFFDTPELKSSKEEVTKIQAARDEAIGEIQNNPWFSQSDRGGKIAGIRSDADRKIGLAQGKVDSLMADAQIKMNLATDQYTLNRQAYQDNLSIFSNLLSSGAFNNASDTDKASWAASTGIPVSMINSIVKTQKSKGINLQTYDDGSNVYTVALDQEGNVVNKTLIGRSKPTAKDKPNKDDMLTYYTNSLRADAQSGAKLGQIFNTYTGYVDPNSILSLYNANSKWGPHKGDPTELARYGVTSAY